MPVKIITEDEVQQALTTIVANRDKPALNYCIHYAKYGQTMTGHELYVQILYVLNNMTHWRGDDAKWCRKILKTFVAQRKKLGGER